MKLSIFFLFTAAALATAEVCKCQIERKGQLRSSTYHTEQACDSGMGIQHDVGGKSECHTYKHVTLEMWKKLGSVLSNIIVGLLARSSLGDQSGGQQSYREKSHKLIAEELWKSVLERPLAPFVRQSSGLLSCFRIVESLLTIYRPRSQADHPGNGTHRTCKKQRRGVYNVQDARIIEDFGDYSTNTPLSPLHQPQSG
ncbi:hypothetical protein LZ32DRAFT_621655 [Colletotrichum eremochloae]|nr:hypothetical protein LZ32DRAFT_621655 [Colletotrichum eremochloae]